MQVDQFAEPDAGAGAEADHLQPGPPEQAKHPGPHTWPQQVLAVILVAFALRSYHH